VTPTAARAAATPPSLRQRLALGTLAWLAFLLLERPTPFDPRWPHAMLLLAVFVLVPLGLALIGGVDERERSGSDRLLGWAATAQLPAAALLAGAYTLPQGPLAAALALPWLAVAGLVAAAGLLRFRARGLRPVAHLVTSGGMVFLLVGAAWAVADRLGYRPLGFPPVIVLLTAVHFHFAGFILPVVAGLAIRHTGGASATLAGWGVILGVPAVAVGITGSQLGFGTGVEAAAAWVMAAAAALVAYLHFRLALLPRWPPLASCLWAFAGLSLVASMGFAVLYGSRFFLPHVDWLDIAWMQALHGAANSIGFATAALAGWTLARRSFR